MYVRGLIGKLAITNYLSPTTVPTIFVPTVSRLTNPIAHIILIRTIERLGVDVGSLLLKKLPLFIGVKYEKQIS